jgi:CRISPR-associated protein Csd1
MILGELVGYYQRKTATDPNAIAPEGWIRRPIDYFMVLSREGKCLDIAENTVQQKKRKVAKEELVPSIGKQSLKHTNSGKDANLLWDNAAFALGYGAKGADKLTHFMAEIDRYFPGIEDDALAALRAFLLGLQEKGALALLLEHFGLKETFATREPIIAFRWQPDNGIAIHQRQNLVATYANSRATAMAQVYGDCLVSGNGNVPIALNETVIKNVRAAQTAGANIVSYNKRAFESYGKRERAGENSPISIETSFAYTTALNHLLRFDSPQRIQVGDATTVFWSDATNSLEDDFAVFFDEPLKGDADPDRGARAVAALFESAKQGVGPALDDQTRFFVLGLAPNSARIAIRFWHVGNVAEMAGRIIRHFRDLEMVWLPDKKQKENGFLPITRLLKAIAAQEKIENVPPNLGGEVMRAILEGAPYPETLLHGAIRRIRAGEPVSYPRAAILKACLNRTRNSSEEKIKMSLDPSNTHPGYRLGRLFAVLERIQEEAAGGHGKINATIRDRFYGAASSTPASVFPLLLRLKNHHLGKIENVGRRKNLESLLGEIVDGLPPRFEPHLSMDGQGRFAVGYYQQRVHPYTYGKQGD